MFKSLQQLVGLQTHTNSSVLICAPHLEAIELCPPLNRCSLVQKCSWCLALLCFFFLPLPVLCPIWHLLDCASIHQSATPPALPQIFSNFFFLIISVFLRWRRCCGRQSQQPLLSLPGFSPSHETAQWMSHTHSAFNWCHRLSIKWPFSEQLNSKYGGGDDSNESTFWFLLPLWWYSKKLQSLAFADSHWSVGFLKLLFSPSRFTDYLHSWKLLAFCDKQMNYCENIMLFCLSEVFWRGKTLITGN